MEKFKLMRQRMTERKNEKRGKKQESREEYCRIHVPKSNAAQMADEYSAKVFERTTKKRCEWRSEKLEAEDEEEEEKSSKASTAVLCLHKFFLFICLPLLLLLMPARQPQPRQTTADLQKISLFFGFSRNSPFVNYFY